MVLKYHSRTLPISLLCFLQSKQFPADRTDRLLRWHPAKRVPSCQLQTAGNIHACILPPQTLSAFIRSAHLPIHFNVTNSTHLSSLSRHLTKIGRIPHFIKSSMGGFLSLESNFLQEKNNDTSLHKLREYKPAARLKDRNVTLYLAACTALSWTTALSLVAFC